MRIFTQTLVALLLAALVVVAGSVTVVAWNKDVRTTPPTGLAVPIPTDPIPILAKRLPNATALDATFDNTTFDSTTFPGTDQAQGTCRIRIRGQKAIAEPIAVAIFGRSGVRLAAATVEKLPATFTLRNLPVGHHQVCLGRCMECIRLCYFTRASVTVDDRSVAEVTLDYQPRRFSLRIEQSVTPSPEDHRPSIAGIPVLLHRVDDITWRHRKPYSKNAEESITRTDSSGTVVFEDLGPGRYRVEMQGFDPDATEVARLTFELGQFDESRPIRGQAR